MYSRSYSNDIVIYLLAALLIRLGLVGYGEWQDRNMVLKFTDVDYQVFTDAAKFVHQGESPYNRATYRYTPILAFILTPNIFLSPIFGKLVFVICDVITGYLIYRIMKHVRYSTQQAIIYSSMWLFNPLPIAVSARGNAESVMTMLVLLTMMSLYHENVLLTAILYGLTVHFKIYPITYALTIYLCLSPKIVHRDTFSRKLIKLLLPNKRRLVFGIVSVLTLSVLTVVFYHWYGWKFLYESYLYHIVRKDIRHNFSPYFYMLYLTAEQESELWIKLLVFLPQLILVLTFSVKYYHDIPFSWFLITFIFVTTNKVCTSQYFLWYLSILPLIIPSIQLSWKQAVVLIVLWFLGQGLWLQPAYLLEFQGQNMFVWIWLAGLLFYSINCSIIYYIIYYYKPLLPVPQLKSKKK
ncbi:hypothetical protein LOTGIDRAFT_217696 [Lottia gigantea]|uniref:GPI alpha-1,4-mannosyltransferase I, catalytic subunit n=1 Tax=Lottia gigantea TaxID=225164 RepID=V4A763_LOTGI|nr:hypothetical protein LOTGIDRAFT_217696 [Lottia gigantea]ESO90830.1 hypothetical protein LOTGIDRAFT_217696 [Lottia gigantea]